MEIFLDLKTSDAIFEHAPGTTGDFLVCKGSIVTELPAPPRPPLSQVGMWQIRLCPGEGGGVRLPEGLPPHAPPPPRWCTRNVFSLEEKHLTRQGNKNHP